MRLYRDAVTGVFTALVHAKGSALVHRGVMLVRAKGTALVQRYGARLHAVMAALVHPKSRLLLRMNTCRNVLQIGFYMVCFRLGER